jgi:hypothetical protein
MACIHKKFFFIPTRRHFSVSQFNSGSIQHAVKHALPNANDVMYHRSTSHSHTPVYKTSSSPSSSSNGQTLPYQPFDSVPSTSPSPSPSTYTPSSVHTRYYTYASHMEQQIADYARRHQQGVTLQDLMSYGEHANSDNYALLRSAQFMHRELPIRLAKRVRELESLPYGLSNEEPVKQGN